MTTIYFVRHGQSEANLTASFAGHVDIALTELGRKQAACTAEFLADKPLTAVYTSDLIRAMDTGRAIAEKHGLTIKTNAALREIDGGDWEGRPFEYLQQTDPMFMTFIRHIGVASCRNGESVADMLVRVRGAVGEIVKNHPDEAVCVVCHGTPIRALTAQLTGIPVEQMHTVPWASNASVTVAEFSNEQDGKLIAADLNEHLKDLVSKLPATI